jgi:hypothetical protein
VLFWSDDSLGEAPNNLADLPRIGVEPASEKALVFECIWSDHIHELRRIIINGIGGVPLVGETGCEDVDKSQQLFSKFNCSEVLRSLQNMTFVIWLRPPVSGNIALIPTEV